MASSRCQPSPQHWPISFSAVSSPKIIRMNLLMSELNTISDSIRAAFIAKNAARDEAIARSRELIRHCAEGIRAIHRREWDKADSKLSAAAAAAAEMRAGVAAYPDLYHSGYTQDALKEVVEAFCTRAIVRDLPLPSPASLDVEDAAYL